MVESIYDKKIRVLQIEEEIETIARRMKELLVMAEVTHIEISAGKLDTGAIYNTLILHNGENIVIRHDRETGWAEGIIGEARSTTDPTTNKE